jgi:protoporphyrinogen oxidase
VVNVFATGPGIAGLKPAKAMDKNNKNLQHTFLQMGSKTGGPMSLSFYSI